ncbi:MAG: carbon-phosphorus lyase [Armatimonadia bacterium]|nr:carbon-phosphorus lyase [Armatimonadia bacterium]
MTFTILGTAAAEGWPALWCPCEACDEARRLGGKNIRRRTAYQLGDRIKIDFGPDSFAQMLQFGLQYHSLEHLLITHSHYDHICPQELGYRREGFTAAPPEDVLTIHGNEAVREVLGQIGHTLEECRAQFAPITPFEPIELGEGVIATPLEADHAGDEQAVFYLLERGDRALLQGNDTGLFPEATWDFLATKRLEYAIIECTYGPREGGPHHLGASEVIEVRERLRKLGALGTGGRVIATHFSHNGGWLHEQLEAFFAPHDIEVAFDGMQLEL